MAGYDLNRIKSEIRITDYAQRLGFTLKKIGSYYSFDEHDSVRIDDKKNCFWRNSQFVQGQGANTSAGSIIDFVMHFEGKNFKAAIAELGEYLADPTIEHTYTPQPIEPKEPIAFELPKRSSDNRAAWSYLTKTRGINSDIVNEFIDRKMIYQDAEYRNAVFVGYNADGKADFACVRGTYPDKKFVKDIEGCNYDKCIFIDNKSTALVVTESIIDTFSYMSILKAHGINHNYYSYNALSGTGKIRAVLNNLEANKNINTVVIAFDNDKGGIEAGKRLQKLLKESDWHGRILKHYPRLKDWNDELLHSKLSLANQIIKAETTVKSNDNSGYNKNRENAEIER